MYVVLIGVQKDRKNRQYLYLGRMHHTRIW